MKKVLTLILSLLFSFCAVGCDTCSNFVFTTLSDDLFAKRVLSFYDIPWLKKPERTVKEKSKKEKDEHYYQTFLQDEQSFWDYGQDIYNKFLKKEYAIGISAEYKSSGSSWVSKTWYLVEQPMKFEDCCEKDLFHSYILGRIEIYYSAKGVEPEYNFEKGGYSMLQPKKISLILDEKEGSFLLMITCNKEKDIYLTK